MIFVTVGTTHFDSLIREVDRLAPKWSPDHKILCQIGAGTYEPTHCDWYRFKPSISEDFDQADLIITHGGFTVLESIWARKRMVAVPNSDLPGNHQRQFLSSLASEVEINWIEDVAELEDAVRKSLDNPPAEWSPAYLGEDLISTLEVLAAGGSPANPGK